MPTSREAMTTPLARPLGRRRLGAEAVHRLGFGLSRDLWVVAAGIFLNYLGYGAVLPFEVIYLHDGRGFSLSLAGLVVGLVTGAGVVTAPLAGPLIDPFAPRPLPPPAPAPLAPRHTP